MDHDPLAKDIPLGPQAWSQQHALQAVPSVCLTTSNVQPKARQKFPPSIHPLFKARKPWKKPSPVSSSGRAHRQHPRPHLIYPRFNMKAAADLAASSTNWAPVKDNQVSKRVLRKNYTQPWCRSKDPATTGHRCLAAGSG